jgi:hypothetical protein
MAYVDPTEPFTQTQYGVFEVRKDGLHFMAADLEAIHALIKYERLMSGWEKEQNVPLIIRKRTVTYSPWDDEVVQEVDNAADAVRAYWMP